MRKLTRKLPITGPIGEPIWCSRCGAALTARDYDGTVWACQCWRCRTILEWRAQRIMEDRV